jgi:hypothetical protein
MEYRIYVRTWKHIHSSVHLREITVGNHLGWLVADTDLETSRAPVDKLDCTLSLQSRDGTVRLLGDDISTVQQANCHVLAVTRIALDHLVVRLKAGHRHLVH